MLVAPAYVGVQEERVYVQVWLSGLARRRQTIQTASEALERPTLLVPFLKKLLRIVRVAVFSHSTFDGGLGCVSKKETGSYYFAEEV